MAVDPFDSGDSGDSKVTIVSFSLSSILAYPGRVSVRLTGTRAA